MGDAGLGVKLFLAVDAADDLAGADCLDDGRDTRKEVIGAFFVFEAVLEPLTCAAEAPGKCVPGAEGNLIAHENANLVDLLPFILQGEQGADFEVPGGDVDGT